MLEFRWFDPPAESGVFRVTRSQIPEGIPPAPPVFFFLWWVVNDDMDRTEAITRGLQQRLTRLNLLVEFLEGWNTWSMDLYWKFENLQCDLLRQWGGVAPRPVGNHIRGIRKLANAMGEFPGRLPKELREHVKLLTQALRDAGAVIMEEIEKYGGTTIAASEPNTGTGGPPAGDPTGEESPDEKAGGDSDRESGLEGLPESS